MSHLTEKSAALSAAATLLHENGFYPAVAHSAYYSCYQQMMHIWLHGMGKTEQELRCRRNSHELLIGSIGGLMLKTNAKESAALFQTFRAKIWKLKKLRTNADYSDTPFGRRDSANSLSLSVEIMQILRKY
jgi:uncharacterized protein (UPF0332 family)